MEPGDSTPQNTLMDPQATATTEEATVVERPDYITPQHWDGETGEVRVESLAKSFSDTKAALDAKFEGQVPSELSDYVTLKDDGTIQFPDGLENLPAMSLEDPMLASVLTAASENNITVEQMQPVIEAYLSGQDALYGEAMAFDPDAIYAGVSDNRNEAEGIVDSVNSYLAGMELSEEHQGAAADMMSTASGIQLLNSLIGRTKDAPVTATQDARPSFDRGAAEARWNELRGMELQFGTPAYEEFEAIGNQLFSGRPK